MSGLRWAGMILCVWALGWLAAGAGFAQPSSDEQARLVSEAEAHERFFRYVDLPDLRDMQSTLRQLRRQADTCPADCVEPDCAGLVASLAAADQIETSLGQLADVLEHLHALEVDHLASLQGEAVRAEDRYRGDAEILLYQRFLVDVAGLITSTIFVADDIGSILESGGDLDALGFAYALNELAGDMRSLNQGLTGQTGAAVSAFDQEMATLQSELGNFQNIAGGNGVRLNALSIIARRMVALGQAEMARRQAEVDALARDAYRERREVDQALTRTHALAVQAAVLRTIAAEARQTGDALTRCAVTCRASVARPDVLTLFQPDPARGGSGRRLDQDAVERLRTLIARAGRTLREGWQPDCAPAPQEETAADNAVPMAPPGPDAAAAQSICFGLSRVGAVQAFDPDLQARLAPQMTDFMDSCTAWHSAVQAWPQNVGNPGHAGAVCRAECAMMADYDRYILAQSPVAVDHVTRLDAADRARQRAAIDAELGSLAASLRLARRADPVPEGWPDWPDASALEAERAALLDRREALTHPSAWAQYQTTYWRLGEAPQMMRCQSESAISGREAQCRAACGAPVAPPGSCVNPAPAWIGRLGEALYPPSHPRRAAFEAQFGDVDLPASGALPGGPVPSFAPMPSGPVPYEPRPLDPVPMPEPVSIPIDPEKPE